MIATQTLPRLIAISALTRIVPGLSSTAGTGAAATYPQQRETPEKETDPLARRVMIILPVPHLSRNHRLYACHTDAWGLCEPVISRSCHSIRDRVGQFIAGKRSAD